MIYNKLKVARLLIGLSQLEMSEQSGINQKDISLMENGSKKFIPNKYIQFLYNNSIDLDSLFDDNLVVSFKNLTSTPNRELVINSVNDDQKEHILTPSTKKSKEILSPKAAKILSPALTPTYDLGHPQVVVVNENDEELVSLVNAKAAAGYLNGYADAEYIESLPTIKFPGLKGGTHRAFEVKGQSMMPTLHNSSISIARFEESFDNIKDRRIYVIVTKYDGIVIKRVLNRIEQTGKLILLSDNKNKIDYPNIIIDCDDILQVWYLRAGLGFEFHEPNELYNRFNDLEAQVTILQESMKKLIK